MFDCVPLPFPPRKFAASVAIFRFLLLRARTALLRAWLASRRVPSGIAQGVGPLSLAFYVLRSVPMAMPVRSTTLIGGAFALHDFVVALLADALSITAQQRAHEQHSCCTRTRSRSLSHLMRCGAPSMCSALRLCVPRLRLELLYWLLENMYLFFPKP